MARGQSLYDWCMENGEYGQKIINEWQGITVDGELIDIKDVNYGAHINVKWVCINNHEWYQKIHDRTCGHGGCNRCYKEIGTKRKRRQVSLYDWCTQNGEFGKQLLYEWTGIDDNGNKYNILDVSKGSNIKFQWKCELGHFWITDVSHRTSCYRKCPTCSRLSARKSKLEDSLLVWCERNPQQGDIILREWQGEDADGLQVNISEVYSHSSKKYKFICDKKHEYWSTAHTRINSLGCKICSRVKINLLEWCIKENTDISNNIIKEYTGMHVDGYNINIEDVSYGSGMRLIWKCKNNHLFEATVCNRTLNRTCCPYCNIRGTSYPEQFLYRALLQIYPNTISRGKYQGVEYDITIPEEKTCIEYSGLSWHIDRLDRDLMKNNLCEQHGVRLIQIYAHQGEVELEDMIDRDFIFYESFSRSVELHTQQLIKILDHILKSFGHSISEIDIEKAQTEAFNFMHNIGTNAENTEVENLSIAGIQIKPEDF